MSKEEILCDSCNQPMRFVERLTNTKPTKQANFGYRRRRFYCDLCSIGKTVYADGQFDGEVVPYLAKEDVKKIYKEQEKNNEH